MQHRPHIHGAPWKHHAPSSCYVLSRSAGLRHMTRACYTACLLETTMTPNSKFPNPSFINDLVNKLGEVLKQSPAKDIEQNLKAGVTSMLGKLDMVSREEFDVQTEVLTRTREKLTQDRKSTRLNSRH